MWTNRAIWRDSPKNSISFLRVPLGPPGGSRSGIYANGESAASPAGVFGWGLAIGLFTVVFPFLHGSRHPYLFLACVTIAAGAYIRTLCLLDRVNGGSRQALLLSLGLAAVWRLPLLLMPPTLSTDVYRYVWDGRIQRVGLNPYLIVPSDPAERELHTTETRLMNHPEVPTPYPAGAELFFRAVMTVDESARAIKLAVAICDAASATVLLMWLVDSGRNPWWVLAYAWNPLVSLEGAGNGHVDLLGTLCLILTAFSLSSGRRTLAALALALGVAVKFLPVVLLPLFWRRIGIRDAALALTLLALLYLPFLNSGGLPVGSLGSYLAWWRINGPLYSALQNFLPNATLLALPAALGLAVAVWARSHWAIECPETWAWPIAIALLFSPTVFPWYLLSLTPFLFSPSTMPLAVWTVSALVTYSSLPGWVAGVVEYGAVAIAIGWMLARRYQLASPRVTGMD
jgi:alpha-1,6-mannosyltransferase